MPKFECSICMEKFDVKKYFHCDKCQANICKQCLKDSIITYGKTLPNCPNCHENISYTLLAKIITIPPYTIIIINSIMIIFILLFFINSTPKFIYIYIQLLDTHFPK